MRQVKIARGKFCEGHVSEDFDLSMRMQAVKGVVGVGTPRTMWTSGRRGQLDLHRRDNQAAKVCVRGWRDGLSPHCVTGVAREKGVFTPLIKGYLRSKTVPLAFI